MYLERKQTMPNKIRPCTLWGETFDACNFHMDYFEVFRNEEDCNYNVYFLGTKIATVDQYADSFPLYRQAITTIAEALNAPVLATEEVLAGLPQGSNFIAHKVGYSPTWQSAFYCTESRKWWSEDEPLDESYIIKSDGCSETLARLLQFTLDGVRIKEKETNND